MGAEYQPDIKQKQGNLANQFDKSASTVRQYCDTVENSYVRPILERFMHAFHTYPIQTTFFTVFGLMSFLPVALSIGFSLFIIASSICLIVFSGIFVAAAILTVLVGVLASVLITLGIASSLLTALLISVYLVFRLGVLVRFDGRAGISEWAVETKQHFSQAAMNTKADDSDSSEASHVLVDSHNDQDKPMKQEVEGGN
ncbi:hypothetical protein SERLA73DRAFT_179052 [Serpula lacrymans var. lacrymans S7.3]|uniref:Uncharacterized protein n=2 Tax=Serpula lacrymans var. lacrymans TaxID=341189 RepID=F8PTM3_SERL3|nr:uncharacterized protein SERLADRAFT_385643 [Serpula lacrymans var. lacrymans S7.9]EGO01018.1 hypothetical protein SERLA73DRAFT_179052 [Serpula lacrymans var. lacrymans S7.3]EGO26686.1 hypothetical protein SERLADRAFT_385643 [Serpula lacrymans var. lacrymans S7.9]